MLNLFFFLFYQKNNSKVKISWNKTRDFLDIDLNIFDIHNLFYEKNKDAKESKITLIIMQIDIRRVRNKNFQNR